MTLLCVVVSCRSSVGEHAPDCTDDRCRGCAPKLAVDQLQVCAACRTRLFGRLSELAELYDDLLTPTKARGGGTSGLTDQDPDRSSPATLAEVRSPAGDGPLGVRHEIRAKIVGWVKILRDDFRIAYPAGDDMGALIAHVDWHANTLLADAQHAERFAGEIDQLYCDARAHAFPGTPPGQKLGDCPACGTPVRATDTVSAECRGCGVVRTIDAWQRILVGDLGAETSAIGPDLVAWLSARHNRPLTGDTLRQWASRGARIPRTGGGLQKVTLGRLGTDQYGRALYSVADAARIGTGLYGDVKTGVSA